ncbi:MAG: hypothetical protein V1755_06435 [Chloroflexota bacterium]
MPTDQQKQVKAFLVDFQSFNQAVDRVLSSVQETSAHIDHLTAMVAKWKDGLTAKTFDPEIEAAAVQLMKIAAVQGLLDDQAALRAALVAYRDKHQGV